MIEILKKTLLTGLGLAVVTKEKLEELGKELAEEAKLTKQEGEKLVKDLLKRSEDAKKELNSKVEKSVQDVLKKMNLVTRSEVEQLEQRLKALEDALSKKTKKA